MSATVASSFAAPAARAYRTQHQLKANRQRQPWQANAGSSPDRVSISPAALQRHEQMRLLDTFSVIYKDKAQTQTKSLAEVGDDLAANLADFESLLGEFFRMADLDLGQAMTLAPDGKGHVFVENDHPDAATVNQLFSENSVLVSRFMVAAARSSIVHTAETNPAFQAAYEQDAPAAIRQFIDELKGNMLGFRMGVSDKGMSTEHV